MRGAAGGSGWAAGADLGTLPGYPDTEAHGMNDLGEVVGAAYGVGRDGSRSYRAFLYDDAARPRMRDLNALIPAGTGVIVIEANGINDAGRKATRTEAPRVYLAGPAVRHPGLKYGAFRCRSSGDQDQSPARSRAAASGAW